MTTSDLPSELNSFELIMGLLTIRFCCVPLPSNSLTNSSDLDTEFSFVSGSYFSLPDVDVYSPLVVRYVEPFLDGLETCGFFLYNPMGFG